MEYIHKRLNMKIPLTLALTLALGSALVAEPQAPKVEVGKSAPAFKIKDSNGKDIDLAKLAEKGPVLVRLTCGCLGCDKELTYFQELHKAYKGQGLTSLAIFKEPDTKVESYVKTKQLDMLYAVDTKGESWKVFQTQTMPSNFLIGKGGKIIAVSKGCDPSGLIAAKLGTQAASLVGAQPVDIKKAVDTKPVAKPQK